MSTLVRVPGIVISASKLQAKAVKFTIECRQCQARKVLFAKPGFGGTDLPQRCDSQGTIVNVCHMFVCLFVCLFGCLCYFVFEIEIESVSV